MTTMAGLHAHEGGAQEGEDAAALRARHDDLLRGVLADFFEIDDPALVTEVEDALDYVTVEAGAKLFEQGAASRAVYVLLSGRLRAVFTDERGQVSVLGEINRGETVGEIGLVTEESRGACVAAVRDSVLARLSREAFEAILVRHPRIALSMTRTIIERFRNMATDRRAPKRPINICLMPISEGIDVAGFARQVAASLPRDTGEVSLLTRDDFAGGARETADNRRRFLAWLREREAASGTVVMIAEGIDPEWTQACTAHADEVVLVADGAPETAAQVSRAEKVAHPGDAPYAATTTLVLVHAEDARTPQGTARWFEGRHIDRHFHVRREGDGLRPADAARLGRELSGRAIGLVLAGGGARGFAHAGVLEVLEREGVVFDRVGGTSIGACFAALAAMALPAAEVKRAACQIFVESGSPTGDYNLLPMVSLIKGNKAYRLTEEAIARDHVAGADVRDTWLPWFGITGNYFTGEQTILERGDFARAIMASLSIPGAFPPMPIDGQLYVDGGTVNNMPVDVMERRGAATIVAVDLTSDTVKSVDYDRIPSSAALLRDRLRGRRKRRIRAPGLAEILLQSAVLHSTHHQQTMRDHADFCIRPDLSGVRLLDWKRYETAIGRGVAGAQAALEEVDPDLLERLRGR